MSDKFLFYVIAGVLVLYVAAIKIAAWLDRG